MSIQTRNDMTTRLIDHMGGDGSVIRAMLVSTRGPSEEEYPPDPTDQDRGRINFLMKNRHGTPFEHGSLTFLVEAPIFVFREFHRHRIGWSYNEISGRYRELDPMFYVPAPERPLVQEGKPGHYVFVPGTGEQHEAAVMDMLDAYALSYSCYQKMLLNGVAKEVARTVLPVGTYTAMYATCNPRSLMAFLSLRTKREYATFPSYPQREIEMVAEGLEFHFAQKFPLTYEAFCKNGRVAP